MTMEVARVIITSRFETHETMKGVIPMAEKMLVTQALDERDLLVKKILDKIDKINFVKQSYVFHTAPVIISYLITRKYRTLPVGSAYGVCGNHHAP